MMNLHRMTLDSQTLADILEKGHEAAKADRTEYFLRTPMQIISFLRLKIKVSGMYREIKGYDARKVLQTRKMQEIYQFYGKIA